MKKTFDARGQRGGLIVIVSLCILGIALTIGLAVETFRLMTTHLQMQNIAEYSSEVVLADIVLGFNETRVKERISSIFNGNWMVGQGSSGAVDPADMCMNNLSCASGVKILAGCYNASTNTMACSTAPACTGAWVPAAYVRLGTFSKRRVAAMMAKMFGVSEVNMSAGAFSWQSGALFMTSPPQTAINLDSGTCGGTST